MSEFAKIVAALTVATPKPGDCPALWDLTYNEYLTLRSLAANLAAND